MNEQQALAKMIAPGTRRKGKYREGVIQVHVTRACDKTCFNCTQGSNLSGPPRFISLDNFEICVKSLVGYFGVVGIFGGNPALHPKFGELCEILRKYIPKEQCGLWCNNPLGKGKIMRETFNPAVSNLNVHLDRKAYDEFKRDWPECGPVGLREDSRHSPPWVAMKDVIPDEGKRWELISNCDINKHWSAMCGEFRGEARAWFCEIAGAQAILHQDDPDYPRSGLPIQYLDGAPCWYKGDLAEDGDKEGQKDNTPAQWWELSMGYYSLQVKQHCHNCGIPLRGHGELAQASDEVGVEQCSEIYKDVYKPKRKDRKVEVVTELVQLGMGRIQNMVRYIQNRSK